MALNCWCDHQTYAREYRELKRQIRLINDINSLLGQPDHSSTEWEAINAAKERKCLGRFQRKLGRSIKLALCIK
jgi:hypothetical protein